MENTTVKMTNAKALTFVLESFADSLPTDVADKLVKMREQIEKKNGAERKPTANQTENVGFKNDILDFLTESPNKMFSVTELMKGVPTIADSGLSNQRVSALLRQLKETGLVERIEDKRKAYFKAIVTD